MENKVTLQKKTQKISAVCGWTCSVSLLICACLLIAGCYSIYQSGPRAFTRASIGAELEKMAIPLIICLACAIISSLLVAFLAVGTKDERASRKERALCWEKVLLRKNYERLDRADLTPESTKRLCEIGKKERRLRNIVNTVNALSCIAVIVVCFAYLLFGHDFGKDDYNSDVIKALCLVIPATVLCIAITYSCELIRRSSISRENDVLKGLLSHVSLKKSVAMSGDEIKEEKKIGRTFVVRAVLLTVAIVFIVLGIFNGGISDVLGKAIRICTECIGLG